MEKMDIKQQIKDELKILCENIKYLRQSEKLSKRDMANIMQFSVNSLRRIEAGGMPNIGAYALIRTAAPFHLHPADLFQTDWRK